MKVFQYREYADEGSDLLATACDFVAGISQAKTPSLVPIGDFLFNLNWDLKTYSWVWVCVLVELDAFMERF